MTFIFPCESCFKERKQTNDQLSSFVLSPEKAQVCVRQKPIVLLLLYFSHPSTSCTWQSSCSRTRWFSLTRMSLKEIKSKYVPRPTNKSYLQLKNLLWDCLRILSASPVSWSCCPAPSPLHFAWNSRFTEINFFCR